MDLTVVVPAFNEAGTIGGQLEALLAQEWAGSWEVVVVDNRSTDATAAIASRWANRSVPVRVVSATAHQGLNHARNVGVAASQARSVAFCDADDLVAPGWVSAMGDALVAAEFVTGPNELDRLNPRWLADSRGRADERAEPTFYGIFPSAHGNNLGVRRAVLDRLGGFDEDPDVVGADDVDLSLRAWVAGIELTFVPEAVVHYRYRREPKELWRQGRIYGRARPLIRRRLLDLGRTAPAPVGGWKSWGWLVAHLLDLRSANGRAAWTWVAANRVGQLEGSIQHRTLMI